jgi:hypothetical protein
MSTLRVNSGTATSGQRSRASFRRPQWWSLRSGLNTRTWWRGMNRIGRRTILAILLIMALAIIWKLFGH